MLDGELTTAQRCQQVDLLFEEQVVLLPPKPLVRLLLDDDDNVPWGDTWRLVALPTERDRLASTHALVDVDLQHLLLRDDLAAIAGLALVFVVDDLARTTALVARLLELLDHRAHLAQRDLDTATGTGRALPNSTLFAALPTALGTDDIASECELRCLALVEVLERDVHAMYEVFCLARALRTRGTSTTKESATEELTEEILRPRV